jgi:UDP-glucose 4-epimerase
MAKRVLITGGAGFIGHHLARRMLGEGHDVTVLDNESTGSRENVPKECVYLKGDVRNTADVARAFDDLPDVVFHVAGQASNIRSFANPHEDIAVNLGGTVNVVLQCLERRVPKLVYAGSMTTYGITGELPVGEDAPLRPISYYGVSKAAAERFVLATAARPDLAAPFSATSLRMFNVYGPGQSLRNPYQGVLAIFIGQVMRGEPCTIDSDGGQTRDFVYIDDVAEAWAEAAKRDTADGCCVNLGSGRALSINDLVAEACLALGRSPVDYPIVRRPARPGDQRHVRADIGLARKLLGWGPKIDCPEGLRRTIEWARNAGGRKV